MIDFKSPFLTQQLITCIGNKRKLLPFIQSGFDLCKKRLGKIPPSFIDGFSGSGVVARLMREQARLVTAVDKERYSEILNGCYLESPRPEDRAVINSWIDDLNAHKLDDNEPGFIERNYAPKDDDDIQPGERAFYTRKNARIIDNIGRRINETAGSYKTTQWYLDKRPFVLAPLIVQASIHTNTSGVFKGFHKKDGVGHWGGKGEHALSRIKGEIHLPYPVFGENKCNAFPTIADINDYFFHEHDSLEYDIAYFDPPYNQHPYGSNYFMLNHIARYGEEPELQDGVSGIPKEWNKSVFNSKTKASDALCDLISWTSAKFIVLSYNSEGIIPIETIDKGLKSFGKVELLDMDYSAYKGSRNFKNRNPKVKELLWILEKK